MKCPSCGDDESQVRLGPVGEQPDQVGYRCAVCGRLYQVHVPGRYALVQRLEQLRAKSAALVAEQEKLAAQLAEIEAQIRAVRDK